MVITGPTVTDPVRRRLFRRFFAVQGLAHVAGRWIANQESPANDPVAFIPLASVTRNWARRSSYPPFHLTVNVAGAPVVARVEQLKGLLSNDPFTLPRVMCTAELLVEQADRVPVTGDGPEPPPGVLSGGEKVTLPAHLQITQPGAAPVNLGDVADAVAVRVTMLSTASNAAPSNAALSFVPRCMTPPPLRVAIEARTLQHRQVTPFHRVRDRGKRPPRFIGSATGRR